MKFLELFPEIIAFKGTGFETIESELVSSCGPSYSISFWLYLSSAQKSKQVTVINKGNNFSSNPLIALQERTLYIKFDLDKSHSEILFSSSDIPVKKWVHLVFTLRAFEIVEASLHINGSLDSEISVTRPRDSEISNVPQKIYIGKDPWSHGLIGSVAEPVFYLTPIDTEVVTRLYQCGRQSWSESKAFVSTKSLFVMPERPSSALPDNVALPKALQSSPPGRSTRGKQTKKELQVTGLSKLQRLDGFFEKNPSTYTKVAQMGNYTDWLIVIFRVLRNSLPLYRDEEGNVDNKIEVDRMIPVLQQIRLNFNRNEIIELAKIMKCHASVEYGKIPAWKEIEEDDLISFVEFFEEIRRYVDSMELGDMGTGNEMETTEKTLNLLVKADDWYGTRSGAFELCIDFCSNCKKHQTSTWHNENEYLQWYNDAYKDLTDEFSSINIFGNKYGPPRIGSFGVFLECLGNESTADQYGRLKLYKCKNRKPNSREIIDSVLLMLYIFEEASEVGRRQYEYKRARGERERHIECLTGPASLGLETRGLGSKKAPAIEYEADTEMFCRNWGCVKKHYLHGKNHKKACNFHPGRWEFGSIHGLWPENWTCCRGLWESQGCTLSYHNGVPNKFVAKKCINRGELNGKTGRPDSVCGGNFPDPATCGKKYSMPNDCRYHVGHAEAISKTQFIWTCCRVEFNPEFGDDSFCTETEHRFTEWPDEEAKIYFVTKSLGPKRRNNFAESAKTSRFFNTDIKPYVNPYHAKKEKEAMENENRYCLNWACETIYKENENHDKACKCHTGYWDFGHSGLLKGKETIVLWEPHWRCCGGKWEDPGCQVSRHNGPLVAKMEERKWKWPSEGAKRNFLKKISHLWQKKLESEHLSRKEVAVKYDQFCSEISTKVLPSNMLHRFTLILHLHILCVSENLSFMFKYQDVISRQAENLLSDRNGYIDKETFLEWWFAPLERIRPEMALS